MAENAEKVKKLTKTRGNELKVKKDKKKTAQTPSKTSRKSNRKKAGKSTVSKKTGRKKKANKAEAEKKENIADEQSEQENKDDIMPLKERIETNGQIPKRNITPDRRISLPVIPTGQLNNGRNSKSPSMNEAPRRISLPLIKEDNLVTSQSGNAEDSGRGYDGKTRYNGFMEGITKNGNDLDGGNVTTAEKNGNDNNNDESSDDNAEFRHIGKKTGKAAMFGKHLMDELNLRYLQAVLNDPDYNDKYKRFATPDLKTDEEDENDILQDFHDGVKTPTISVSEKSVKGDDDDDDSTETELAGSNEDDDDDDDDSVSSGELDAVSLLFSYKRSLD